MWFRRPSAWSSATSATGSSRRSASRARSQSVKTLGLLAGLPGQALVDEPISGASRGDRILLPRCERTAPGEGGRVGMGARPTPYLCECEDAACTDVIGLTRVEYEEVRAHPKRFVLASGHQESDSRLVQEAPRFTVIE